MSKQRQVIAENCERILGFEDGALRDVDDGRYAVKPLRLIPKEEE